MKNILFIIDKISNGGAQRVILNLAKELNKYYNIYFCYFDTEDKEFRMDSKYYKNVTFINLNCGKSPSKLRKILNTKKRISKLKKIKKIYNIYVSISFLTTPNYVNVKSKCNDKTIISIRNKMSEIDNKFLLNFLHKVALKKADKIVNVTNSVMQDEILNFDADKKKMCVINNYVDEDFIKKLSTENLTKNIEEKIKDKKVLINIGRFSEQKNQILLLEAFKDVIKYTDNALLILIGQGDLENLYKNKIKEWNLENKVLILPFDINPYKYIKNSNVFVLPSKYEGMPNVILESLALNVPVICLDSKSGVSDILDFNGRYQNEDVKYLKNGIIIKDNKNVRESLKNAIINILTNEKYVNMYKNVCVPKDLKKENIINKWIKIINELL